MSAAMDKPMRMFADCGGPAFTSYVALILVAFGSCGGWVDDENESFGPAFEGESATKFGWVRMGEQLVRAEYTIDAFGRAFVSDDILVTPVDSDVDLSVVGSELAVRGGSKWPVIDGVVTVPYEISSALSATSLKAISIAMDRWRTAINVDFVPRQNEVDAIVFEPGNVCASNVGRLGGMQSLIVSPGCMSKQMVHEIGHALGAFHEHTRSDRDEFVTVNWSNIQNGSRGNFEKYALSFSGTDEGPYDLRSVMHYASSAFASDSNAPTLVQKQSGAMITINVALSAHDI